MRKLPLWQRNRFFHIHFTVSTPNWKLNASNYRTHNPLTFVFFFCGSYQNFFSLFFCRSRVHSTQNSTEKFDVEKLITYYYNQLYGARQIVFDSLSLFLFLSLLILVWNVQYALRGKMDWITRAKCWYSIYSWAIHNEWTHTPFQQYFQFLISVCVKIQSIVQALTATTIFLLEPTVKASENDLKPTRKNKWNATKAQKDGNVLQMMYVRVRAVEYFLVLSLWLYHFIRLLDSCAIRYSCAFTTG